MQLALVLILAPILLRAEISYTVDFEGLNDGRALKALRQSSQLVGLKEKPPSSLAGLRFRAESDRGDLVKVLQSYGYFEGTLEMQILETTHEYRVKLQITPGPLYVLAGYQIHFDTNQQILKSKKFTFKQLGLIKGEAAVTQDILDAEQRTLKILSESGFPLARIKDRKVVADGKSKTVMIDLEVQTGPLAHFGEVTVIGNRSVRKKLIDEELQWDFGNIYDSNRVEASKKALLDTGLFCSVTINHGDIVDQEGNLPLEIEVIEAKHKSVSAGASYQTTFGPGVTLGWENRNVRGLGRRLIFQADIAQRSHSGLLSYQIPNAWKCDQDLIFTAQASHEAITAYHDQSYQLFSRIDWQVSPHFYFSAGGKAEYLIVTSSVDNGNFMLFEAPILLRASNVSDCLNPIKGATLEWRAIPSINVKNVSEYYCPNIWTFCNYLPLFSEEAIILAQKISLGAILSNGLGSVPVPKRFFGGSEDNLRGYKYLTVSPLDHDHKPIGGRSALFYSAELRLRYHSVGLVPFFDLGNVPLHGKWRKSVGIGLRYFSFIGPLRLDVAFPLNRRPEIDPHWWVFVCLGQAF